MRYWNEVVQDTTTFTLPNPDEYERPEEIREIEVNRVKARSVAVEGEALSFGDKLRASLLGQLNDAMSNWEDRDLRRSFVHMQVLYTTWFRDPGHVKYLSTGVAFHLQDIRWVTPVVVYLKQMRYDPTGFGVFFSVRWLAYRSPLALTAAVGIVTCTCAFQLALTPGCCGLLKDKNRSRAELWHTARTPHTSHVAP